MPPELTSCVPTAKMELVRIAKNADEFVAQAEALLDKEVWAEAWLKNVDEFLATMSWDETWARMSRLITSTIETKRTIYSSDRIHAVANDTMFCLQHIA